MAVEIINNGERITARLSGEIDHHSLKAIRSEIDAELELSMPKLLVLDFGGVSFMDSSGIGLILGRMRLVRGFGGNIVLCNTEGYAGKIIKLAGLGKLVLDSGEKSSDSKQKTTV